MLNPYSDNKENTDKRGMSCKELCTSGISGYHGSEYEDDSPEMLCREVS
jgi:hypothetical protein